MKVDIEQIANEVLKEVSNYNLEILSKELEKLTKEFSNKEINSPEHLQAIIATTYAYSIKASTDITKTILKKAFPDQF